MKTLTLPALTALAMLLVLSLVSFGGALPREREDTLKVSFLDVGQGDATFIESPTGTQVLIDGGKGSAVLGKLQNVMGFFDRDIDMVVATHPDMDHIGGLIDVLKHYNVKTILMTENMSDTPAYEAFLSAIENENGNIVYARRGQVFDLGVGQAGSTTLLVLFPDLDPTNLESNTSSIVTRLVYGESEFVFMGDAPQEIEEYLVGQGSSTLKSDVLKVGHHGSRTSTSELFLKTIAPIYAIISAGKDNSYGHPHKEVTDILMRYGVEQKNTANFGSIFLETNGSSMSFR